DARQIALVTHASISICDVASGKETAKLANRDGNIVSLVFSPDGTRIATSAWGKPIQTPLRDGTFRSSASKDHIARVRDVATDNDLVRVPLPDGGAGPVTFSSDGRLVAVCARTPNASLKVLGLDGGMPVDIIKDLPPHALSLAFSRDGKQIAGGFNNGTALVWKLRNSTKSP